MRAFVDIWNCTLFMRNADAEFRADWAKFGPALAHAAAYVVEFGAASQYQAPNFYDAHDSAREADRRLHRWATVVMDAFPGVSVSIVPRQRKRSSPVCPTCHNVVA